MDCMIDLETMGLLPGCAVLSIGAVMFDRHGTEVRRHHVAGRYGEDDRPANAHFHAGIDLVSSLMAGLTVDQGTVEWWQHQDDKAREALADLQRERLEVVVAAFEQWWRAHQPETVWANGPASDVVWWEAACRAVGRRAPWDHGQARDCRTIYDAAGLSREERSVPAVAHDALEDAMAQARDVQISFGRLIKRGDLLLTVPEASTGIGGPGSWATSEKDIPVEQRPVLRARQP